MKPGQQGMSTVLQHLLREPPAAKRAFEAMMRMRKIDIAAIKAARRG